MQPLADAGQRLLGELSRRVHRSAGMGRMDSDVAAELISQIGELQDAVEAAEGSNVVPIRGERG